MTSNPYAADLGDADPIESLRETPEQWRALVRRLSPGDFARSYAPGKWTATQVLVHLAQAELMIQARVRFALTVQDYVVQPFEQDDLLALESGVDGPTALEAYLAVRRLSLPLLRALTDEQLARRGRHPQMGEIDVRWILVMLAGHELRHLRQLQQMI